MQSPFGCTWSEEIARRCKAQGRPAMVASIAAALGATLDCNLVELPQLLDLVRSCNDVGELGDAMAMIAATVPAEPDALDCYLLGLTADVAVLGGVA